PGIPGVGPKTAVKWLQEHGDLETLVKNAAMVSGKIGEKLRDNLESLWLSHRLATIKRDVLLELEIDDLVHRDEDIDRLHALFSQLEFKSWIKEAESKGASSPASPAVATEDIPGAGIAEGVATPETTVGPTTEVTPVLDEAALAAC